MKILYIDDDHAVADMVTAWLKTLGYDARPTYTVERARAMWVELRPDLVIMETTFQGTDLLAIWRELRNTHDPLLIITTDGRDVLDEVRCLELGADDYLRKPFFPSQLLAHIHAVNRRARSTTERRPSSVTTVGPIHIDSLHNEVTIHGRTVRLSPTESKLLHLLAVNANDVCTASQIVSHIWGYDGDGDTSLIKAHIRHLRMKIEPDPKSPQYILTVPGVGYTLARRSEEETNTAWKSLSEQRTG